MAFPNRMSLRRGLLWRTLNLALCACNQIIFPSIYLNPEGVFAYPRLNTTAVYGGVINYASTSEWCGLRDTARLGLIRTNKPSICFGQESAKRTNHTAGTRNTKTGMAFSCTRTRGSTPKQVQGRGCLVT